MELRRPTLDELRLLRELAVAGRIEARDAWLSALRVRDMPDGSMGSLELDRPGPRGDLRPGVVVRLASVQFTDDDGVEVIASLNARHDGVPFELDVWKTNFGRLIRIPHRFRRLDE